jgi:maleamate amidohydrolase
MTNQSETAKENYAGVWGNRVGFGKKAAIVVIDFVKAYTLKEAPLYAVGVVNAVQHSADVIGLARQQEVLIIHTCVDYQPQSLIDGGAWMRKSPVLKCLTQAPFNEFCDGVEPLDTELIVKKQYASAFFGTSLSSTLTAAGVDTVILLGCSTSGCVRASAVDGVSYGFNVIVVRECVGDRHDAPHEANLFDIDSKYGDVVRKAEILEYLASVQ